MPTKKIVVIDTATIYTGRGGAGGGVWSYTANLLIHVDLYLPDYPNLTIICLANNEFNLPLKNIKVKKMNADFSKLLTRLFYIHFYLPVFCLFKNAVLHKVTSEVPWFSVKKTIVTVHDCMAQFYKRKHYSSNSKGINLKNWYFESIDKRAVNKSYLIFTPSNSIKLEIVENFKIDAKKIIPTHLAATNQINSISAAKTSKSEVQLYCIAAFHRHKGHLRLIEIFEKVFEKYNLPMTLNLRGHIHNQEYYNEVKSKVENSPAKNSIKFVSYDRNVKIGEIYSNADWVILLSEYEGFGLPVIEAQACGVPVICSDIGVFKETAENSVIYISNNLNTAEAAETLYSAVKNEEIRNTTINLGLENYKRFSWDRLGKQMLDIYDSV